MSGLELSWIARRYQVTRLLGKGGMGSVYEAMDSQTNTRVAVKVIMTELQKNQTLMGRFEREARAAADIDTPHIVRVFDAGTDPDTGMPYMVMEYLEGEDLQQLLRRTGPLPTDVALRIGTQGCIALQKAHENRIVHRDIKPANFFLAKNGDQRIVKLLDFGVAKIKPELTRSTAETAGLTRTGSMLGSPLYMSPEQARGHKDLDHRSDIWSMGIVLYQSLAGRTPHHDTEELGELIILICTEPPAPLQDVAPWVPPQVAAVVHRALRFDPGGRYQSAAEMLQALQSLVPYGWGIQENLIRALSDQERTTVAPRLTESVHDAPPGRRTNPGAPSPIAAAQQAGMQQGAQQPGMMQPGMSQPGAGPVSVGGVTPMPMSGGPMSTLSSGAVGTTVGNGVNTVNGTYAGMPPARSPVGAIVGAAAAVVLIGGGFAVYQLTRPAPAPAQASTQSAPALDPKSKSVKVVILPSDATVDVDGIPTPLRDGLVEIKGVQGTVYKVHVAAGGEEKTVEVVVTENGALPPKIELVKGAGAAPAATSAAAPVAPTVGPKPKAGPSPVLRTNR